VPATTYPESGVAPPEAEDPPQRSGSASAKAATVRRQWDEGSQVLVEARKNYWLNLSFYLGKQWVWWDDVRRQVDGYPDTWSPLGPEKECLTINRIGPNLEIVIGRMLKAELAFQVPPTDSSDAVIRGARTAEKVLEASQREQDWEMVRYDGLAAAFHGGTSAVMVEWDGTRGTELQFDQATDQVVSTGDAYLRALNCQEFVLEPTARHGQEARWAIVGLAMPCDAAKEQYRLDWTPRPDVSAVRSPVHIAMLSNLGRSVDRDQCLVLTRYERPHPGNRKGSYCIVINDKVVHEGPWPFPFKNLNVHPMRQRRIDGKWFGTTFLNDAVRVQVAYNFARSVIAEHLKLVSNTRIVAPMASFREEDLTDRVGDVLWYNGDGGAAPAYMVPPNLARFISQEPESLRAELDEIMHIHDISRGQGFDRASGQALALLSEKDESPLGIMSHEQSAVWGRIATQVLKLYEAKGGETRTSSIRLTRSLSESVRWSGKMLQGQTSVVVPLDSVMAKPAAAREAFWRDLWDRKIVTDPRQYARGVGLPPENFEELLDADEAKAHNENFRMMQGFTEIPEPFDDDAKHIAEHNRFRKSDHYRFASEEGRAIIDDHIRFHENQMHEQMAKQVNRAQVNPALAAMPQADAPPGAMQMPTSQDRQMEAAMAGMGGMGMDGSGQGGAGMALPPGGTTPALAAGVPEG